MRRRKDPPADFTPFTPDLTKLWIGPPPRTAVIEVEWFDPADDAKSATAAEAACDLLMERLIDEGVVDPAVSLTLPDRMRRGLTSPGVPVVPCRYPRSPRHRWW